MKTNRTVTALITLLVCLFWQVNRSKAESLGDKLSLAQLLLEHQATAESLKDQTHYGFTFQTGTELGYSLKNSTGDVVQAYVQQTSHRVFFVEFYETARNLKDLLAYLPTLRYAWVGNEKNCDYLNNGHLALTLCPQAEKGVRVCVNLMPR